MLKIKNVLYLGFVLWLASCSGDDITTGNSHDDYDPVGTPILFSVGLQDKAITRTPTSSPMAKWSHFVCTMYYHSNKNDNNSSAFDLTDGKITKAWLEVSDDAGNATYKNEAFSAAGTPFYWQNRLNHIFLALTDNHDLDGSISNGSLKIYPDVTDKYKDKYMLAYDLTRGEKKSMSEQPDPILALETARPSGGTPEANRVKLFFKHQFAQIQVNLKSSLDESAVIKDEWIESVELLGVAETGYVPYCILPDGTLPAVTSLPINVDADKYQKTIKDNPYGSSFNMFQRSTPVGGYLRSFECIAFGTLQGIRITWRESDATDAVKHVATYKGVKNLTLKSGTKYIYNMELRRSLIAEVTAKIKPWEMDTSNYSTNGTIKDDDQN